MGQWHKGLSSTQQKMKSGPNATHNIFSSGCILDAVRITQSRLSSFKPRPQETYF